MRPIDADKLIEYIDKNVVCTSRDSEECKQFMLEHLAMDWFAPTLDVVPREEVERIKQENAREIFADLEPCHAIGDFTGSDVYYAIRVEDYNRCKKKYTEDSTDGKRTDR